MKVEILNQFTQKWVVDNTETVEVFRTHKTLDRLKESLDLDVRVIEGDWSDDGVVSCVFGILADGMNDIGRISEFYERKCYVNFGEIGFHTLDEIKKSDLVWILGFGIVDETNINKFEEKFRESSQRVDGGN